MDEIKLTKK